MLDFMPFALPIAGTCLLMLYVRGALRTRRVRRHLDAVLEGA